MVTDLRFHPMYRPISFDRIPERPPEPPYDLVDLERPLPPTTPCPMRTARGTLCRNEPRSVDGEINPHFWPDESYVPPRRRFKWRATGRHRK